MKWRSSREYLLCITNDTALHRGIIKSGEELLVAEHPLRNEEIGYSMVKMAKYYNIVY